MSGLPTPPSVPSVSPARPAIAGFGRRAPERVQSAYSDSDRPPLPRTVTVSSPPDRMTGTNGLVSLTVEGYSSMPRRTRARLAPSAVPSNDAIIAAPRELRNRAVEYVPRVAQRATKRGLANSAIAGVADSLVGCEPRS